MPVEAIVTLVISALIIAAAGVGLLRVIFHLKAVSQTLGALDGGVQVIVQKTSTVPSVVGSVNSSLAPVRAFAESI